MTSGHINYHGNSQGQWHKNPWCHPHPTPTPKRFYFGWLGPEHQSLHFNQQCRGCWCRWMLWVHMGASLVYQSMFLTSSRSLDGEAELEFMHIFSKIMGRHSVLVPVCLTFQPPASKVLEFLVPLHSTFPVYMLAEKETTFHLPLYNQ